MHLVIKIAGRCGHLFFQLVLFPNFFDIRSYSKPNLHATQQLKNEVIIELTKRVLET